MNKKIKTFFFLIYSLILNSLFAQEGFLKIESIDSGLTVTLDDSIIGTTPLSILKIKPATYTLRILNPERGIWKNNDWVQQIGINPYDTTIVKPVIERSLIIRSDPFDAQVFLDNQYRGNTPFYLDLPILKNRMLLISKEHYKPYLTKLLVDTSTVLNVTLEPIKMLPNELEIRKKTDLNRNRTLTYSLMALTICSGFATVYFNQQAELKYNQYLKAGNLQDMNRYYNEAKKLDKISGFSLGMFEISFVLSFYFLTKVVEY